MIMIIAIIYIYFYIMWYLMNSWKLLSENPQPPLEKSTPHFFLTSFPKNSKIASPLLFANIGNFLDPPPASA